MSLRSFSPRLGCKRVKARLSVNPTSSRPASNTAFSNPAANVAPTAEGTLTPDQRFQERRAESSRLRARAIENLQFRKWKPGDQYAPHDLTSTEQRKWSRRQRPTVDAFDMLSMNPLEQYTNFSIMSEYMTEMGRIRSSSETGLRRVNQRKIAKAIRRAVGIGIMPSAYRHPEIILRKDDKVV